MKEGLRDSATAIKICEKGSANINNTQNMQKSLLFLRQAPRNPEKYYDYVRKAPQICKRWPTLSSLMSRESSDPFV